MKINWLTRLINILKDKELMSARKKYYLKKRVRLLVDSYYYDCAIIPTIYWGPWFTRHIGEPLIHVQWLIFHIEFGEWCKK